MPTEEEQNIANEVDTQFGVGYGDIGERESTELPKMVASFCITNAFLSRSQTSGRKQLEMVTVIKESNAGDKFVGKEYTKRWGLETDENLQWLNTDMRSLGIEPPAKAGGLIALCQMLIGICFKGTLVLNKDEAFPPNMFINRGARREDLEEGGDPSASRF